MENVIEASAPRWSALRVFQTMIRWEWPMRVLNPFFGDFNPFLPEFRADPYPVYRALQAKHRVYSSRLLAGTYLLPRYDDIVAVLADPRFSVDRRETDVFKRLQPFRGLSPDFVATIQSALLTTDPPAHTRLRRMVNKAFTPRVVEGLRARVQALVDELLDAVAARGEMELIRDLAYPLPVIVIADLLGIPREDRERIKEWSDTLALLLDPLQAVDGLTPTERAYHEITAYMRPIFTLRREQPRDDLISALVAVEDDGQRLSETELLALSMLILGAGHETTTNLIANGVLALLRHPDQRRRLQDDPSLIGSAVEEFLRYDSPVQLTDRAVTVDCEIAGQPIRRGAVVALLLGAANRDPSRFADPDRLDIDRHDNHHLSFGHGAHFCLGAALARLEAQIAIATLLRRFPDFDGQQTPAQWKRSMVLRGPIALRVWWRSDRPGGANPSDLRRPGCTQAADPADQASLIVHHQRTRS
jgi:cytochrome P450